MKLDINYKEAFENRHIAPNEADTKKMLDLIGVKSINELIDQTVPSKIRLKSPLNLPPAKSEFDYLNNLKQVASKNKVFKSYIGQGYYDCITPGVIQRNILENPGWYTQYTPYQAEIAQGRLEALLNFQTLITDLTGLEIANASLLDEATAAAEAMAMCQALKGRKTFFVSDTCHPQTLAVVRARAEALGIAVVVGNHQTFAFSEEVFGALVQYPATDGTIHDYRPFTEKAHLAGALVIVAADLLSLVLSPTPDDFGADVAVGSAQRFGVPMGYGGPHAAFIATRDAHKRHLPGRIVGVSKDAQGRPALRLALQTREQHIRREKATSNICTAQVLLAIMASMYAVYHGPEGLKGIAERVHRLTAALASGLQRLGFEVANENYFDTLRIQMGGRPIKELLRVAEANRVNLRVLDSESLGVTLDEATSLEELELLMRIFNADRPPGFRL